MTRFFISTVLAVAFFIANAHAETAPAKKPMLLANYYTWYATGPGKHGVWTHWITHPKADALRKEAKATGKVVQSFTQQEIASVFWPLAGLYDSDDAEIVRWHIRLAKAAGIDAFLVDWWGSGSWQRVPRLTESAFEKVILPIAREENFKVALLDEPVNFMPLDKTKIWVADYLAKYKDDPAYLKIDGKPVYYIYQVCFKPGTNPDQFAELKQYVEAKVGPVYWMCEAITNGGNNFCIPDQWLKTEGIDSFSFYSTFSIFHANTYEQIAGRYAKVTRQAHETGRKMCLPVHPGHNNTQSAADHRNDYDMDRRDGQTLKDYLRAATDAGADYVMITSFNEWPESTVIEPSSSWADPYQYLKILAEWKGIPFVKPEEPARVKQNTHL